MSPNRQGGDGRQHAEGVRFSGPDNRRLSGRQTKLLLALANNPPPLQDPATPYTSSLKSAGVGDNLDINWTPTGGGSDAYGIYQQTTAPALIAGGKGSAITQYGTFLDPTRHERPIPDRADC